MVTVASGIKGTKCTCCISEFFPYGLDFLHMFLFSRLGREHLVTGSKQCVVVIIIIITLFDLSTSFKRPWRLLESTFLFGFTTGMLVRTYWTLLLLLLDQHVTVRANQKLLCLPLQENPDLFQLMTTNKAGRTAGTTFLLLPGLSINPTSIVAQTSEIWVRSAKSWSPLKTWK